MSKGSLITDADVGKSHLMLALIEVVAAASQHLSEQPAAQSHVRLASSIAPVMGHIAALAAEVHDVIELAPRDNHGETNCMSAAIGGARK